MVYRNAPATSAKTKEIQEERAKDSSLMRIARYVAKEWPTRSQIPADVKPYWSYKEELSMINGILFNSERLIILALMEKEVLKQLHQAQMGMVRTKWRATAVLASNQSVNNRLKYAAPVYTIRRNNQVNQ